MNELYIGLAAIGGVVLLVQVASSWIKKKWFLTGPLIALAVGILFGPVFSLIQPEKWESEDSFLLEVTRLTLLFGDMAISLRLPVACPLKKWKYALRPDDALATVAGLWVARGGDGYRRAAFPQNTRLVSFVSLHKASAQLVRHAVCRMVGSPWGVCHFLLCLKIKVRQPSK